MPQRVPLATRVVEVIADHGASAQPRYRYGSGCVVVGRTVLTAAHVISGAQTVNIRGPDKQVHPVLVDPAFVGDGDGPRPDLALLKIDAETGIDLPGMELAAADRDSVDAEPVSGCHAVGYPWFAERPSPDTVRDTADAHGQLAVLSKLASGLLSLQVSSAPRPLPLQEEALGRSPWSGMSGAPVVAAGCLLGVVTEHAPREGSSTISVTPLTALERDPVHPWWGPGVADPAAWWAMLGGADRGAAGLQRLPRPRHRPDAGYRATILEIHARTGQLIGRQAELRMIAKFATGPGGYRWLIGGPWVGKTALLAEAAVAALSDHADVVAYFLSRREADADANRFLAAVVPQLAALLDEDPPLPDVHQFRALWVRAAAAATATNRPLLLLVDGLDEDIHPAGSPSVAAMLPSLLADRAHVLVSSREYPELPVDVPVGHPLRAAERVRLEAFEGATEMATLAAQEIDQLTRRDDGGLATAVLGILTAAGGPLSVADLTELSTDSTRPTSWYSRRVRRLVTDEAARSLQGVDAGANRLYQFAHGSLLEHAQADEELSDPGYRTRIHDWAKQWQASSWPVESTPTPRYLLDTYPRTLKDDQQRLTALAGDPNWVAAAIQTVGVDAVLAVLRTAAAVRWPDPRVAAVHAGVRAQAHHLRGSNAVRDSGFVSRQLCLQAAELEEHAVAAAYRDRLLRSTNPGLVPQWTSRRASSTLVLELGRTTSKVWALAVLPDGRVVTGEDGGRVSVWDPASPHAGPVDLGDHGGAVSAMVVTHSGRAVTGGHNGWVRVWDHTRPEVGPLDIGQHGSHVYAMTALPDGRLVSAGTDGRVLIWEDPTRPSAEPIELGHQKYKFEAVATLLDGRVITDGHNANLLVWNPTSPRGAPIEFGHQESGVSAIAVLPSGGVITGGYDGTVLMWDLTRPGADPLHLGSHEWAVGAIVVLPSGQVITGGYDRTILLWDPTRPQAGPLHIGRHDHIVRAAAVLPDGSVVTGGDDQRVLVWDHTRLDAAPIDGDPRESALPSIAVLPDGRVVTGGDDLRVQVWDPTDLKRSPLELGHDNDQVAVLRDGRVVTAGEEVQLWDLARRQTRPIHVGHHGWRMWAVGQLPDNRLITVGSRLMVWDSDHPQMEPVNLGENLGSFAMTILADGRVVTGSDDGMIQVWDPARPDAGPTSLGSHGNWVWAIASMPDGRVVTGGRFDGLVRVWDPGRTETGPSDLGLHGSWVRALTVLPDGQLISAANDGWIRSWDVLSRQSSGLVACSVTAFATSVSPSGVEVLVMAHAGGGLSGWYLYSEPTPAGSRP